MSDQTFFRTCLSDARLLKKSILSLQAEEGLHLSIERTAKRVSGLDSVTHLLLLWRRWLLLLLLLLRRRRCRRRLIF